MLKLREDRINYWKELLPPVIDGRVYKLVQAVGTTYSLDLESLLAVCIPLGLREATDSDIVKNPMAVLKALQDIADKLVVFCDAGHITEDRSASKLMLMLDKVISEVKLPRRDKMKGFPSFHPKTWFIKYADGKGHELYRVIVLSRNLTTSRSWDVAVSLNGNKNGRANNRTKPLGAFMSFLNSQIASSDSDKNRKHRIVRSFTNELPYVDFPEFKDDRIYTDYRFLPLGIGKYEYDMNSDQIFNKSYNDLFVMSPFITADTVLRCSQYQLKGAKYHLFTNTPELYKFKDKNIGNLEIFTLRNSVVEGEFSMSGGENEGQHIEDIHAKIVLFRRYSDTTLYLGSMNYSKSGTSKNVEMMFQLGVRNRCLNIDTLERDLFGDDINSSPFRKVNLEDIDIEEKPGNATDNLEQALRAFCRTREMQGMVAESMTDGKYDVTIHIPFKTLDTNIELKPIRFNDKWTPLHETMTFEGLDLMQISELYKVRLSDDNGNEIVKLIKIPTDIPEERDRQIVKSIISDKKAFIYYLAFILGDDAILSTQEGKKGLDTGSPNDEIRKETFPAIYEKMLKAAYSSPDRLKEIKKVYDSVKDANVVPEDFSALYDTFIKTLKLKC